MAPLPGIWFWYIDWRVLVNIIYYITIVRTYTVEIYTHNVGEFDLPIKVSAPIM